MEYQKLAATIITASIFAMNLMPAACIAKSKTIENTDKKSKKTKLIKSQVSEYRFDYINSDWWKSFNDEYLNEYIIKSG